MWFWVLRYEDRSDIKLFRLSESSTISDTTLYIFKLRAPCKIFPFQDALISPVITNTLLN